MSRDVVRVLATVASLGTVIVLFVAVTMVGPPGGNERGRAPSYAGGTASGAQLRPSGPIRAFGDGSRRVGDEIVAGRYRTAGPRTAKTSCYWERMESDSGSVDAIIANGNFTGPGSVSVQPGEFFSVNGECFWELAP